MLKTDAIAYFGSPKAVAHVLGITERAVYSWDEMVPPLSAAKLWKRTRGRLKFDPDLYDGWNKRKSLKS